jgi:hypothetical protein
VYRAIAVEPPPGIGIVPARSGAVASALAFSEIVKLVDFDFVAAARKTCASHASVKIVDHFSPPKSRHSIRLEDRARPRHVVSDGH